MSPIISGAGVGTASGVTRTVLLPRATQVQGNLTVQSTAAYAELAAATGGPGTGGFDLVVAAATNDILQINGTLIADITAPVLNFDMATIVSAAAVNWVGQSAGSNANDGLAMLGTSTWSVSFSTAYKVVSGDISGGNVTLRLFYLSSAASNRTLFCSVASGPVTLSVSNLLH